MIFERHSRPGPQPMLTPLIDIVFLLLIFFLLTGTFQAADPFIVRPPVGEAGSASSAGVVMILVAADGRVAMDNRILSVGELETMLTDRFEAGLIDTITVKADAGTPSGVIVRLLTLTRRSGALRVRLVTLAADQTD